MGIVSGSGITLAAGASILSAKADDTAGSTPMTDLFGQACSAPARHCAHVPQLITGLTVATDPTSRPYSGPTPSPRASTRPTVSCPMTCPTCRRPVAPVNPWMSLPQIPVA